MLRQAARVLCNSARYEQSLKTSQIRGMAKVNVNGTLINYEQAGTGDHVVLCMPGVLGWGRLDFAPQLRSLAGSDLTLVAWDPPGYGHSRPPDRQWGPQVFVDDARAAGDMMEALGHTRYSILGWSHGGSTAILLASQRPHNVSKLVIWAAHAFVTEEGIGGYEAIRDIGNWSERMRAPMLEMYEKEYFERIWNAGIDRMNAFKDCENGICRKEAAQVQCPTLVLHGGKDPLVRAEQPLYLVQHIRNARLHLFPAGKHNVHMRYAEEFNRMVAAFLLTSTAESIQHQVETAAPSNPAVGVNFDSDSEIDSVRQVPENLIARKKYA